MPKKAATPYAVLAWKPPQPVPDKRHYDDPEQALAAAVEYLKTGHQVRLSDAVVAWFAADTGLTPTGPAAAADGAAARSITFQPAEEGSA
jgi:hypothetical protein